MKSDDKALMPRKPLTAAQKSELSDFFQLFGKALQMGTTRSQDSALWRLLEVDADKLPPVKHPVHDALEKQHLLNNGGLLPRFLASTATSGLSPAPFRRRTRACPAPDSAKEDQS